jgi:hypothetical protein
MRVLISMAASLMLMLALVGPVAATEAGPGCSDFGAVTADFAKSARPFGQLVSLVNHGGILAPNGVFYTSVGQLIEDEHTLGIFTWACAKYR